MAAANLADLGSNQAVLDDVRRRMDGMSPISVNGFQLRWEHVALAGGVAALVFGRGVFRLVGGLAAGAGALSWVNRNGVPGIGFIR